MHWRFELLKFEQSGSDFLRIITPLIIFMSRGKSGMGFRHDVSSAGLTFGVASTSAFLTLCCTALLYAPQHAEGRALSQSSSAKPTIYVNIASWENRTAYPRFIIYRDQFRKRLDLDNTDSSNVSDEGHHVTTSFSKPADSIRESSNSNKNSSATVGFPTSLQEKESLKHEEVTETTDNRRINSTDDSSASEQFFAEQRRSNALSATGNLTTTSRLDNTSDNNEKIKSVDVSAPLDDANYFQHSSAARDKEIISFPKDINNPCNRLQINPDDNDQAEISSEEKNINKTYKPTYAPVPEEVAVSIEIDNRQNFPYASGKDKESEFDDNAFSELVVPTVDLTMKIIGQSHWNDDNVVFSPLSIANVLSMLLLGAGGETFKELSMQLEKRNISTSLTALHTQFHRYHDAFRNLMKLLRSSSGTGATLISASELFVDKRFPVNERFIQELKNYYDAPVESFNFGKEGYIFMNRVNQWVREKTQNQIPTILEEPPSSSTTLGVINAIYFKGLWEMPFSEKLTRLRNFGKTKAKMMLNIQTIPYVERNTYRIAAVPYKGNKTALYLILPKGNDGINDLKNVEKDLTRQNLNESISLMEETKLTLMLPKLKFSSDGEMNKILQNIGLSSVFNRQRANFSAISPQGLYISQLLHRAVVEINEKGTEASAVTLGTADRIFDDQPILFACDKPFIFFIYHVPADTILFWGRIVRPDVEESQ